MIILSESTFQNPVSIRKYTFVLKTKRRVKKWILNAQFFLTFKFTTHIWHTNLTSYWNPGWKESSPGHKNLPAKSGRVFAFWSVANLFA